VQSLSIDMEVLPVPQDGLQGNLTGMHEVWRGQDQCCSSKIPLAWQRVFPPAFPARGRSWAGWCPQPRPRARRYPC